MVFNEPSKNSTVDPDDSLKMMPMLPVKIKRKGKSSLVLNVANDIADYFAEAVLSVGSLLF